MDNSNLAFTVVDTYVQRHFAHIYPAWSGWRPNGAAPSLGLFVSVWLRHAKNMVVAMSRLCGKLLPMDEKELRKHRTKTLGAFQDYLTSLANAAGA